MLWTNIELIDDLAAIVHADYVAQQKSLGITSRSTKGGNELLIPYDKLKGDAKEQSKGVVRSVLDALRQKGYNLTKV